MANAIDEFFAALPERGAAVLPSDLQGTIRFDLVAPGCVQQWYVTLGLGKASVVREVNPSAQGADCIVRTRREVFERLASGLGNVAASVLANRMTVEGDLPLLLRFQRFFPDAPGARDPRVLAIGGQE